MIIQRLDSESVRLLGSTEVVVSPVSVVKELVENALDSGATRISVRMDDSGLGLIEVADNGCGIAADSMAIIGEHHCTSKATSAADLIEGKVDTYGFRGEALASIAAVAGQLNIASCCPGEPNGRRYVFDQKLRRFGTPPAICAMQAGTVVSVSKLFLSLPVRRDYFAKSKPRCRDVVTQCRQIVAAFSLCRPACRFSLKHGSISLWESSAGLSVPTLLALTAGPLINANDFIHFAGKIGDGGCSGQFEGFVPSPKISAERQSLLFRSSTDHFYIFVNSRPITDKDIAGAIKAMLSESSLFAKSGFPVGCIKLTIPKASLDANVDVAKRQVFFGLGKESILEAIKSTLTESLISQSSQSLATPSSVVRPSSSSQVRVASPSLSSSSSTTSRRSVAKARNTREDHFDDLELVEDDDNDETLLVDPSTEEPSSKKRRRVADDDVDDGNDEQQLELATTRIDANEWSRGHAFRSNRGDDGAGGANNNQPVEILLPPPPQPKPATTSMSTASLLHQRMISSNYSKPTTINNVNNRQQLAVIRPHSRSDDIGNDKQTKPHRQQQMTTLACRLALKASQSGGVTALPASCDEELLQLISSRPVQRAAIGGRGWLSRLRNSLLTSTGNKPQPQTLDTDNFNNLKLVGNLAAKFSNILILIDKASWSLQQIESSSNNNGSMDDVSVIIDDEANRHQLMAEFCKNTAILACSQRRLSEAALFASMMASVQIPKRSLGHNFSLGRYLNATQLNLLATLSSKPSNPPLFNTITDNRIVANGFKIRVYLTSPSLSLSASSSSLNNLSGSPTKQNQQQQQGFYCEVEQSLELPEPHAVTTPSEIGPVVAEIVDAILASPRDKTLASCRPRLIVEYFKSEVDRLVTMLALKNNSENLSSTSSVGNNDNKLQETGKEYLTQLLSGFGSRNEMMSFECPHGQPLFRPL